MNITGMRGRGFDSFVVHLHVLWAVLIREMRTRFGRKQLGYLWAFIEPLLFVGTFSFIFMAMGRRAMADLHLFVFLVTGIIPWLLFTNTYSRLVGGAKANESLLTFPQVTRFDVQLARALLELATSLTVGAVMLLSLCVAGYDVRINDITVVVAAMLVLWLLGIGLGTSVGVISSRLPSVEPICSALLRIIFFSSGVFFTTRAMPPVLRDPMLYNPILNLIEVTRSQFSGYDFAKYSDFWYALIFALVLVLVGLVLDRAVPERETN